MNDDQQSFRFVIPGFASVTVIALAFAASFPRYVWDAVGHFPVEAWVGIAIGSGALGFLLSQAYFASQYSLLDYQEFFQTETSSNRLLPMLRDNDRRYVDSLFAQARRDRRAAYDLGTFLWQKLVADDDKALNTATSRAAARTAAIGATWIGVAVGFVIFLGWSGVLCGHAMWLFILRGSPPCLTCCWRPLPGTVIFTLALAFLGLAHRRLCKLNQRLVLLGLAARELPRPTETQPGEHQHPSPQG